jgi:peptide/bleomycin uptake transporter
MFKSFFASRRWMHWSFAGGFAILAVTWFKVQLDVRINEWFGDFYNTIQKALATPNAVSFPDFLSKCLTFAEIAGTYMITAVLLDFFARHYVFRWRTAMNGYYMAHWGALRHIEGAAQRVQEDTMRFARIVEQLGVAFIRAIMILIAFLPILWELSKKVTVMPWIGAIDHSLVYLALISAAAGTVLLALVGIKLPGLEFNNQRVEAALRKELVYGEDYEERAQPETVGQLFDNVRRNYFRLYKHYLYFDIARYSYLQFGMIVPYIAMGPTIVAGVVTLGVLQQTLRAFDKVETSFQFLVHSWSTIIELISIYKRLRAFEATIGSGASAAVAPAPGAAG